jgi:hypothetical protein
MYISTLYAHAKFREKLTSLWLCKKDKKRVPKRLSLVPNFVVFT